MKMETGERTTGRSTVVRMLMSQWKTGWLEENQEGEASYWRAPSVLTFILWKLGEDWKDSVLQCLGL